MLARPALRGRECTTAEGIQAEPSGGPLQTGTFAKDILTQSTISCLSEIQISLAVSGFAKPGAPGPVLSFKVTSHVPSNS